jgi:hypothetical protein
MEDLAALQQAHQHESREYERAASMHSAAALAMAYFDSAIALVVIDEQLSCQADHAVVRNQIMVLFPHYARLSALLVQEVQTDVAYTKVPGLALIGSRLRDDLRQLVTLFEHPVLLNQGEQQTERIDKFIAAREVALRALHHDMGIPVPLFGQWLKARLWGGLSHGAGD